MPREFGWSEGTCALSTIWSSGCSEIKLLYLFLGQSPNSGFQMLEAGAWTRVGAGEQQRSFVCRQRRSGLLYSFFPEAKRPFWNPTLPPKLLNWLLKFYHFCFRARQKFLPSNCGGKGIWQEFTPIFSSEKCSWIPSFSVLLQSYFMKKKKGHFWHYFRFEKNALI